MSEPRMLTPLISFEEMVRTDKKEFREINAQEGEAFIKPLTRTAKMVDLVFQHFGKGQINSGYRGPALNDAVGGSKSSQHCSGEACDFNILGKLDRKGQLEVMKWIIEQCEEYGQLLLERGCIHYSQGTKREVLEYDVPTKSKKPIPELAEVVKNCNCSRTSWV